MTGQPKRGQSGSATESDAKRLHDAGYTATGVHAKWVLDACETLRRHLFEDGRPVPNGPPKCDSSYYLTAEEWREVAAAGRTIADLAPIIATHRDA